MSDACIPSANLPTYFSNNGGDNGWGNCGHNSSGGEAPISIDHEGNGGFKKGDYVAGGGT